MAGMTQDASFCEVFGGCATNVWINTICSDAVLYTKIRIDQTGLAFRNFRQTIGPYQGCPGR